MYDFQRFEFIQLIPNVEKVLAKLGYQKSIDC